MQSLEREEDFMNKTTKREESRMPIKGRKFNFNKVCNVIICIVFISVFIMMCSLIHENKNIIAINSTYQKQCEDLQKQNESLQQIKKDAQQEIDVLHNEVITLQTEVNNGNQKLFEYEEKLKQYETKKPDNQPNNADWGSKKTYMSYKAITNKSSKQYALQQIAITDADTGVRTVDGDYCVAIGTGWGFSVGDKILVTLSNGKTFNAIVGDIKSNAHTNSDNKTTSHDGSVVEFIVDIPSLPNIARKMGNLNVLNQFSGGIVSITQR